MPWQPDFIDALKATSITPIYELEIVRANYGVGAPRKIQSDYGKLRVNKATIRGTSVTPNRWAVSFGGFEISLVGDIRPYKRNLMRGCIAILRVKLKGLTNKERIGIGQLDSISGQRGRYVAKFKDIISAFQSRIDYRGNTSFEVSKLFYETVVQTTVATSWSPSSTSLVVADSSGFNKSSAHAGLLYCTPPSGGGDPFYMRWSSKNDSTNTFTLTSGTASHPSTASASTLGAGSVIQNAVRINAAPHALFAQVITSTGAGTNGIRDVLPDSYGTGFPLPHSFVDMADAQQTTDFIVGQGGVTYAWDYTTVAPLDSGFRSLMDTFSAVGQWPVIRQNSFTWRGCFDPTGKYGTQPLTQATISDNDIIEVYSVDFFDPSLKAVYSRSSMVYDVSGSTYVDATNNFPRSIPVAGQISRNFGTYYDPAYNESAMAQGDVQRMKIWDFYNWTRLSMRVHLKYAVLCAGDKIEITSAYLVDSYTDDDKTYVKRQAMILEIGYNLDDRSCDIVVGVPPVL